MAPKIFRARFLPLAACVLFAVRTFPRKALILVSFFISLCFFVFVFL
jgi:hypothetical protein